MIHLFTSTSHLAGKGRAPALVLGLAAAAALPLWAAAVVVLGPVEGIDQRWVVSASLAWAGLLVAFVAGVRLGIALGPIGEARRARAFLAAAGFMILSAGVFFAPPVVGYSLAVAGMLLQALLEVSDGDSGRVPGWWTGIRMLETALFVLPVLGLLVRISLGAP
jgi:hypothetical protein